ncbi:hypothetical protein GCM10020000_48580 [Streptomyces olivoverticillatus]
MVYSCAVWESPEATLEDAQRAKLDLVCRKLALEPGMRLLDVGCGWGSMVLHAAREYGVGAVGITLSEEQAAYARKRVAEAGLTDRIEIRVQDYREIADGPFDAISSIGMAEHVGSAQYAEYAADLHALLKPGGRLLNHQIARRPLRDEEEYRVDEFIDRYVFPDGELAPRRPDGGPAGAGRLRGARRGGAAGALRADAARVGGQPGGPLGRGRAPDVAGQGPGVAAVHGGVRLVL